MPFCPVWFTHYLIIMSDLPYRHIKVLKLNDTFLQSILCKNLLRFEELLLLLLLFVVAHQMQSFNYVIASSASISELIFFLFAFISDLTHFMLVCDYKCLHYN